MSEMNGEKRVLALYDVRGIQSYIFRRKRVKDAIGASKLIENIVSNALKNAIENEEKVTCQLEWYDDSGIKKYKSTDKKDIEVLFIGGGNAYVMFSNEELCKKINRKMSYYILKNTYSLPLAIAYIDQGNLYAEDYKKLNDKMNQVKADMPMTKPLGALPIMKTELETGYPMSNEGGSTETLLKKNAVDSSEKRENQQEKDFESYISQKGVDSMLAVVHIDGNSMGIRIRNYIKDKTDYSEAVNAMRTVSYHIKKSYRTVFEGMKQFFETSSERLPEFEKKKTNLFVREILVAGDDVTYVCNAKIALATVEYFCREITKYSLNGETDDKSIKDYGFSVCAGVAYFGSHFPFGTAYKVAEACCHSAKEKAKKKENRDGDRIGNFVDFHICRNVHALNFKEMRMREYRTSHGENLLIRPYFVRTEIDSEADEKTENKSGFDTAANSCYSFEKFKSAVNHFQDERKIPRSFAKALRNTYALGKNQMELLCSFLDSRGWKMPKENSEKQSTESSGDRMYENGNVARWFDALEMMDYYIDLSKFGGTTDEDVHKD